MSETVGIGQSAERAFPTVALGGSDPEPEVSAPGGSLLRLVARAR